MSIVIIFNCLIRIVICILLTTLCLSMCSGLKYGSNSNLSGSMLMGDWRRPLLHMFHTGFMRPQKPVKVDWIAIFRVIDISGTANFYEPGPEIPS